MKHRLLTLIFTICILSLAACGGETLPAKEPDPPQPAETPAEPVSPEESPAEDAQPETLPPLVGTPLTEEELAQVNGAFDYSQPGEADQEKKLERSCFFTSSYEDVTELNLEEFLRYYSNGSSTLEDEDAEEFQALAALPWGRGGPGARGKPPRRPAGARPPHPTGGGGSDPGDLCRHHYGGFKKYERYSLHARLRFVL